MENDFDVAILGTSLSESIAAAALSKSGLKVLHLDTSPTYGSSEASLSLIELHHFLLSPPPHISDLSCPLPISSELLKQSRHYAISLKPSIVPAIGPLVDCLVSSGVAKYVPFKLLDNIGLYNSTSNGVDLVPASKEDVFKSKKLSLLQKRKLMKFLMATASLEEEDSTTGEEGGFLGYLTSSKVGLEKDTAEAIVYALSLSSNANEPVQPALKRLKKYIRSTGRHGNSPFIVGHFGGAGELAQGYCRACAVNGGMYILGRPFTVSRLPADGDGGEYKFGVKIDELEETLRAKVLLSSLGNLPETLHGARSGEEKEKKLAKSIAILDGTVYFRPKSKRKSEPEQIGGDDRDLGGEEGTDPLKEEDEDVNDGVDTAVLVFPPNSLSGGKERVVTAFISGPGCMNCPDGKRVIHLSTEMADSSESPEQILQPYLDAIVRLNRPSGEENKLETSIFYSQSILPSTTKGENMVILDEMTTHIAEFGDRAAQEAERAFWEVVGLLGMDGRSCKASGLDKEEGEKGEEDELITTMWSPIVNDDAEE